MNWCLSKGETFVKYTALNGFRKVFALCFTDTNYTAVVTPLLKFDTFSENAFYAIKKEMKFRRHKLLFSEL